MPTLQHYTNSPSVGVSPYRLALFSYFTFLISWVVPSAWYTNVFEEHDYLFLHPGAFMFYTLCIIAFILGIAVVDVFFPAQLVSPPALTTRIRPSLVLLIPLLLGTIATIDSVILLVRNNPLIIDFLVSQQGFQIKETVDVHQPLALAGTYLLGTCWWAAWRKPQLAIAVPWERRMVSFAIGTALLSIALSATLRLSRGDIIPVFAGTALVYLLRKDAAGDLEPRIMRRRLLLGCGTALGLFALFAVIRGSDDVIMDIMMYTMPSYNRLAAVLDGRLHYPFAGQGVYLSPFLSFNTMLNSVMPIADMMHWPQFEDVWQSEFTATWQAGLDGRLIWCGTFGYLFADVGWLAPLIVGGYGLLYGYCWRSAKLGRLVGIILYPWLGALVLLWFTTNNVFDSRTVVLWVTAVGLLGYERLLVLRRRA